MNEGENVIKEILKDEKKFEVLTELAFKAVDKDGSGSIDQPELEKIMAQICMEMGAEVPSKEDVQEVLNDLDEGNSKSIEYEEFKDFIKDILEGMIEDVEESPKDIENYEIKMKEREKKKRENEEEKIKNNEEEKIN